MIGDDFVDHHERSMEKLAKVNVLPLRLARHFKTYSGKYFVKG